MKIQTAEFVTSVGLGSRLPVAHVPQIAFVGRSNVGKSTLINALAHRKIARAGGAPGTTRLLNVYRLQLAKHRGALLLIDLPGYGYARGGEAANHGFDRLTRRYFQPDPHETPDRPGRTAPAGAILLVDARHPGLATDCDAVAWLSELRLPMVVAATKVDRLKASARRAALKAHELALGRTVLPISAKLGDGLPAFWTALLELAGL
ncbi:MAG: ribosome biogenesis GTP-binding protein YsxC [Acidobacteria bacterium]|jgi:GTP-binding protein|nr:ribosome biogenesis GTP-binding protein YsxC [Acidobacteriota bacterium]MDP7691085.1 ribosome biogenesis GTP-binding protein YihA/YsxC [Vicinamibacterales bacterium]HJN43585.1 ribosome biogenesis GTP-binding protein YihA/YsxC [Vicinamibacterales bacterium]